MLHRMTVVGLVVLFTAACEGPMGPMGPAGPEGAAGPGTRLVMTAVVDEVGQAVVTLPAAAGTLADPPGLTCYVGEPGSNLFFVIGTDLDGPLCALAQQGAALLAIIDGAPTGWNGRFVIVY